MASHHKNKNEDQDSDEENPTSHAYKPPQKVDLNSIVAKDESDDALTRYKQQLLGNATDGRQLKTIIIDPNDSRIVLPVRVTLIFENHKPDAVFELSGSLEKIRETHSKHTVTIKEGEPYRTLFEYYVQRDIVTGLKVTNKVLKARTITVDKSKYMIGSKAPSNDLQKFFSETEHAPSGMLSRGSFLVKCKITDDDKNVFAEWEWNLVIAKDWQ